MSHHQGGRPLTPWAGWHEAYDSTMKAELMHCFTKLTKLKRAIERTFGLNIQALGASWEGRGGRVLQGGPALLAHQLSGDIFLGQEKSNCSQ